MRGGLERWKRVVESHGVQAISYGFEGTCDAHVHYSTGAEALEAYSDAQRTAEISVDVWSRRAVQQISLNEVDAFPSKATAYPIEFPGGIRVEVSYRGRDRWLKLPLGSNPTRAAEEDTAALHAALIEDLA
jgi:hypothetical protein